MIFAEVKNGIKDALFRFCLRQCSVRGGFTVDEVEVFVNAAFEVFGKVPFTDIQPTTIYRYHLYAGEEYTNEILPSNVKENGVICERCIHLCTFLAGEYSDDDNGGNKIITRGYDVVYDLDSEEIILLYRVLFSDNSVITIYRVETDYIEDFEIYKFMLGITVQMTGKLQDSVPTVIFKEAA